MKIVLLEALAIAFRLLVSAPAVAQTTMTDWTVHNYSSASEAAATQQDTDSKMEPLLSRLIPHPYLSLGPSLMGGGYAALAFRAEGGLNVESERWVMKASAAYDNGHKVNDNDQPNPKGHDRYLEGGIYFRPASLPAKMEFLGSGHWFVGAGWRWSQLSTTNYTKGGSRPQIGGGYDLVMRSCPECKRDFSMRIAMDWVMAGNDWQNGSHGPEITISFPTPREKRHLFWQERLGVYRYHQSITDSSNLALTQLQRSQKSMDSFLETGILYRF
jgi:hypothetical protein